MSKGDFKDVQKSIDVESLLNDIRYAIHQIREQEIQITSRSNELVNYHHYTKAEILKQVNSFQTNQIETLQRAIKYESDKQS